MICGDDTSIFGSGNLDERALAPLGGEIFFNKECSILVQDKAFAAQFIELFFKRTLRLEGIRHAAVVLNEGDAPAEFKDVVELPITHFFAYDEKNKCFEIKPQFLVDGQVSLLQLKHGLEALGVKEQDDARAYLLDWLRDFAAAGKVRTGEYVDLFV